MGEVVNLRLARKAQQRDAKHKAADEGRHMHGLSKAQRQRLEAERQRANRAFDGHRRDPQTEK